MKPLTTYFMYVAANGSDFGVNVRYGNVNLNGIL